MADRTGKSRAEAVNAWAVVVAAGAGERLGRDVPKAFVDLAGRPMIEWSMAAIEASTVVSGIVVVVPPTILNAGWRPDSETGLVVAGGRTRQESVVAGIAKIPAVVDVIVVHDAARPLAEPALFRGVVEALGSAEIMGAVPVIISPDTVKRVADGRILETVARDEIGLAQTPQAFVASALLEAHERAHVSELEGTDDAMLLEACGFPVAVLDGDPENFKITTEEDLQRAEEVLARRHAARPERLGG